MKGQRNNVFSYNHTQTLLSLVKVIQPLYNVQNVLRQYLLICIYNLFNTQIKILCFY